MPGIEGAQGLVGILPDGSQEAPLRSRQQQEQQEGGVQGQRVGLQGSAHICKWQRLRLRPLNIRIDAHPQPNEKQEDFMSRCMADYTMRAEFPDEVQRLAVCIQQVKDA